LKVKASKTPEQLAKEKEEALKKWQTDEYDDKKQEEVKGKYRGDGTLVEWVVQRDMRILRGLKLELVVI
jgi:hypothetical protein